MPKRTFLLILMILSLLSCPASASHSDSIQFKDGEKQYAVSEEAAIHFSEIAHTALQNAPEIVRNSQLTLEQRAEQTCLLTDEEREFATLWGIPQADDISLEQALYISYTALKDQLSLSDATLASLFPVFTFEVTNPDTPMWCLKFLSVNSGNQIVYMVKLYSKSGCLAEINMGNSVG